MMLWYFSAMIIITTFTDEVTDGAGKNENYPIAVFVCHLRGGRTRIRKGRTVHGTVISENTEFVVIEFPVSR